MSIITSVGLPATIWIAPAVPATTMAALAMTPPETGSLSVDTTGYGCPAGHTDRKERGPGGTTVMLREYAPALAGMLHEEVGIGTWRYVPYAANDGGPKAPVKGWLDRVSITLQGVIAMNVIGPGAVKMLAACAIADEEASG